ncbi:MAG: hypothetical protein ABIQ07_08960 [Ginsengibacter sp.]
METNNKIITPTSQLETNAEYISVKGIHDQPPIITSVFKSIFVEIPKEFYVGIKIFFLRFINLFKDGFKYLKYPSLKIDPFATKDYKESCQHTFEFSLVVTALLIFLIKLDWIFGEENLKAVYNNDISQALMQFFIFICFAVYYSVLVVVSVLAGRLFRIIFKLPVTRQECDILFTYLNNVLFLITASLAFILRCIVPYRNIKGDEDTAGVTVFIVYGLIFGIMIFRWAGRFALLNNIKPSAKLWFQIVVTIVTTIFFAFCSIVLTSFIWGV